MMKKILGAAVLMSALVAGSAYAGADKANIQTAMMSPALINPVTGKMLQEPKRICNDSKMACIPGVDTCCDGTACPADKVCP